MADDCNKREFYAASEIFGGTKKIIPCVPGADRTPDQLYEVTSATSVKEQPGAIWFRVWNMQAEAFCSDLFVMDGETRVEAVGEASIVVDGQYKGQVLLNPDWGVEESVQRYIIENDLVISISNEFHANPGLTSTEVAKKTKMSLQQAALLLEGMQILQRKLNAVAEDLANTQLDCLWYNSKQEAECPADADGNPAATQQEHPDAVSYAIVPAGVVSSRVSYDDANAQARAVLDASLNCFFISDTILVDCRDEDRPGFVANADGSPKEAVVDDTLGYGGRAPRKGSNVVPAGYFISRVSKKEANDNARLYGWSTLVCYYINDAVEMACGSDLARNRGMDYITEGWTPAVLDVSSGQSVRVPIGHIVSDVSTAEATSLATDLAKSHLECCYLNDEITASCDVITYDAGKGEIIEVKAKDNGNDIQSKVIVPRGTVVVCLADYWLSQGTPEEDQDPTDPVVNSLAQAYANQLAREMAYTSLQCIYCNVRIDPKCVPDWVLAYIRAGKISLPLDLDNVIDPDTGIKVDTTSWSTSLTIGVAENTICSSDFFQAQEIADLAGSVELDSPDSRDDCEFANDKIVIACAADDPYNPGMTNKPGKWYERKDIEGNTYWFMTMQDPHSGVSKKAIPAVGTVIEIPFSYIKVTASQTPGTIPSVLNINGIYEDNPSYDKTYNDILTKNYANELAKEYALLHLDCFFDNSKTIAACDITTPSYSDIYGTAPLPGVSAGARPSLQDTDGMSGERVPWLVGPGKDPRGLSPAATARVYDHSIIIPEGMYRSYDSLVDVFYMVNDMVESLLLCPYCNDEQYGFCEDVRMIQSNKAVVPKCTVMANSRSEANRLARELAAGMVACVDAAGGGGEGEQGPPGPPGPPGADGADGKDGASGGTDCEGTCHGVYA